MDNLKIRQINSRIQGNRPLNSNSGKSNLTNSQNVNQKTFEEVFQNVQSNDDVKFSKHAKERIESRNIEIKIDDMEKINSAVDKAKSKGVNTALILMRDTAFIANTKNKTIITTVTKEQLKENVFTNIDGAVII